MEKGNKKIKFGNGVVIEDEIKILLDPIVSDFISFVSHSHSDHLPNYIATLPITTKETKELAKVKFKDFDSLTFEYNKKIKFFDINFTLYDANHILGSFIAYIEKDGASILYAPDFRLESFDKDVEILIIESTFGDPIYKFPSYEEEVERFVKYVKNKVEIMNKKVEIGAYALGKAQEIIKILNEHNIYPQVSKTIEKYNKVYEKFGIKLKCENKSNVIIRPFHEVLFNPLPNYEQIFVTGWALTKKFNGKGFVISDHLDFYGLLKFVENVNPKIIYTFHGFSEKFAEELRKRGYNAISIESFT